MSTDKITRRQAGSPASTGGQFAPTQLAETGTVLTADGPAPEWGADRRAGWEADRVSLTAHHADLVAAGALLAIQRKGAVEVLPGARNADEARTGGADVAELEFMMATVDLETVLSRDDLAQLTAEQDVDRDFEAAVVEARACGADTGRFSAQREAELIWAMDLETDMGAGHRGWHEWHSQERADTIRELAEMVEVLPNDPLAPLWAEKLAVLTDPHRVRRLQVGARRSAAPGPAARYELATQAETEVGHLCASARLATTANREA